MDVGSKPVVFVFFFFSAHDQAVCALHFNPRIPNCILTGSSDKTIKIWDIKDHKPACISSRDLGIVSHPSPLHRHIHFIKINK